MKDIKVLSFSANATKSGQNDGDKALPVGNPGWAVRKKMTASLLTSEDWDFVALQHVDMDQTGEYDAYSYFYSVLNKLASYDATIQPKDPKAKRSEVNPLFWNQDKWRREATGARVIRFVADRPSSADFGRMGKGGYTSICETFVSKDDVCRRVCVVHTRLMNGRADNIASYRAKCLYQILKHVAPIVKGGAPVIILADTNINYFYKPDDLLALGRETFVDGKKIAPPFILDDAWLTCHPGMHDKVRSEHRYIKPERGLAPVKRALRNDRILHSDGLEVTRCEFIVDSFERGWPSYHFPLYAHLRFASDRP